MSLKLDPVTKKQIREIASSYAPFFHGWKFIRSQAFVRRSGPILQCVCFEALRSGAYRPSTSVEILVAPKVTMLHQFLDVRSREIMLREHEKRRSSIAEAMRQQFMPSIVERLDTEVVFQLCETSASNRLTDVCGVASLAAYLGMSAKAIVWCSKSEEALSGLGRRPATWELELYTFAQTLKRSIESGGEKEVLNAELEKHQDEHGS